MTWFRQHHNQLRDDFGTEPGADPEDSPDALLRHLREVNGFVNGSAGRLPGEAVVLARRVTDVLREVIGTSADRELDVRAVGAIRGILTDYLPTTLRSYLALDPQVTDLRRPSGRTPRESLAEQLGSLRTAADDLLAATRAQDADALLTQGSFLRTKFTGSDLDL
jgi:hypothetical protein